MLYSYIMLALCVSIDALGTGITSGLKNTKISTRLISGVYPDTSKIIPTTFLYSLDCSFFFFLFIFSFIITSFSLLVGNTISGFLSNFLCNLLGGLILCIMGLWIIFQGPEHSDLDNSNYIDTKESLFLAIALSLDSIGVYIGGSLIGITSIWFPIVVSLFQLVFCPLVVF